MRELLFEIRGIKGRVVTFFGAQITTQNFFKIHNLRKVTTYKARKPLVIEKYTKKYSQGHKFVKFLHGGLQGHQDHEDGQGEQGGPQGPLQCVHYWKKALWSIHLDIYKLISAKKYLKIKKISTPMYNLARSMNFGAKIFKFSKVGFYIMASLMPPALILTYLTNWDWLLDSY